MGAPDVAVVGASASGVLGAREASGGTARDRGRTALWGWPLAGTPAVVHGFDPPEQRWSAGHRGIDLAGVAGEAVLAVDDGVVTYSGTIAGVGMVSVTHASGLRSTYQPVADRVGRGTRVARGDGLGRLGEGGHCVLQACLHLGAVRGRDGYVDPTPLLMGVELTLLPVEG
ncbi:Membrane protein [Serinicoccus hydrothermalis]|uniref:Membrane protein n=1 Tax=Serinicoccus hydrothermalis TaxID=1758689 RepID=A0A1B1NGY3_9MICO|nr:M23 family metallopeptidase [Serinicoccus hydrothermalis]ANS80680.1 Membrane protein [Serinicoccus hydrothermalis]